MRFRFEQEPAGQLWRAQATEVAKHVLEVDGVRRNREDGEARNAPMPVIAAVLDGLDVPLELAAVGGLGGVGIDAFGPAIDLDGEEAGLRSRILDDEQVVGDKELVSRG